MKKFLNPENPCGTTHSGGGVTLNNKIKNLLPLCFNRHIAGFTLSEVLITLTILGVIATLVVPNVVQSYKKVMVETRLRQAYSILDNVLEMAKVESGSFGLMIDNAVASSSTTAGKTAFFGTNYLRPYLNVRKVCANNCSLFVAEPSINQPGITVDTETNHMLQLNGKKTEGSMMVRFPTYQMELANGMFLGVSWFNIQSSRRQAIFVIDVNGSKKPNRIGYDIFYFSIWKEMSSQSDAFNAKGDGVYAGAYLYAVERAAENASTCSGNGIDCSAVIKRNGWKIPDNYPVKNF